MRVVRPVGPVRRARLVGRLARFSLLVTGLVVALAVVDGATAAALPEAVVSPVDVSVGSVRMLSTSNTANAVRVTNTPAGGGSNTLTIDGVTKPDTRDCEVFTITTTPAIPSDGLTRTAGQFIDLSIGFTPTARRSYTCVVTIDDDDGNPDTFTVTGTGIGAIMTVSTGDLNLGSVRTGGPNGTATFTIRNANGATEALDVTSAIVTVGSPPFTISALPPGTIPAGEEIELTVTFNPSTLGAQSGLITITGTDPETPAATIDLDGVGTSGIQGFSPAGLVIGNVVVGDADTGSITITNTGTATFGVTQMALGGGNASEFSFASQGCTGLSCATDFPVTTAGQAVTIRCTPSTTGTRTTTLTVTSDAETQDSTATVTCNGTKPDITVAPPQAFGDVRVGTPLSRTFTVSNAGGTTSSTLSYTLVRSGLHLADYVITTPTCSVTACTLAPGGSRVHTVTFTPGGAGPRAATITVNSDDQETASIPMVMSGAGVEPVLTKELPAGNSHGFGDVDVGDTSEGLVVRIRNTGTDVLKVDSATVVPSGPSPAPTQFRVSIGSTGTQNIPENGTAQWTVVCEPTTRGAKTATFRVANDSATDPLDIGLTCNGTQAVLSPATGTVNFGVVPVDPDPLPTRNFTITNTGNEETTVTALTVSNSRFAATPRDPLPFVMPAGETLTVDVTFDPQDGSVVTGTVTVISNNSNDPIFTVTGDGQTSGLDISPSSIPFGDVRFDDPDQFEVVTVTNSGEATFTVQLPTVNNVADYRVQAEGSQVFPATLTAGTSARFRVIATPGTTLGQRPGVVTVVSNLPAALSTPINVTMNVTAPDIAMSTTALDFGAVDVDVVTGETRTVSVQNDGNELLTIQEGRFSVSGGSYTVVGAFPLEVPPGESRSFEVRFAPRATGPAQVNTLTFAIDAFSASELVVSLTGIPVDGQLALSATTITFADTYRNPAEATSGSVTVNNTGGADLVVCDVEISGAPFALDGTPATVIPHGGSIVLDVDFTPTSADAFTGTVTITTDEECNQVGTVALQGTGIGRNIAMTPEEYDLGTVGIGIPVKLSEASPEAVQLINRHATDDYVVTTIGLLEGDSDEPYEAGQFRLLDDGGSRTLVHGTQTGIDIEFVASTTERECVRIAVFLDGDPVTADTTTVCARGVDVKVRGSGCQAGDSGGRGTLALIAVALAAVLLRRRRRGVAGALAGAVLGAALVAGAPVAHAQTAVTASRNLDLANFAPAPATEAEMINVEGTAVGDAGAWAVGLAINHATNPLVVSGGDAMDVAVTARTTFELALAYAIAGRFEVGLRLPLLQQAGDAGDDFKLGPAEGSAVGDVALHAKAFLVEAAPLTLATSLTLTAPTATEGQFAGVDGPTGRLRGLLGIHVGRLGIAANVGFLARQSSSLGDIDQGNQIEFGGAASYRVTSAMWAIGEIFGGRGLSSRAGAGVTPVEGVIGVRVRLGSAIGIVVGGGRGLMAGVGAPEVRGFLVLDYAPRARAVPAMESIRVGPRGPDDDGDDDGDAVSNGRDECAHAAEDVDGWKDDDGCPDADNDLDGLLDGLDRCVDVPEDKDGVKDDDGCPEPDDDGDNIADVDDKCPLEPEDMDGFQDGDGCDEPDNDADGVPDVIDQCALEPETINGNGDDDGCPDQGDSLVMVAPDRVEVFEPVRFTPNSAKLVRKSFNVLGQVAATLRANRDFLRVRVTVHVHPRNSKDLTLSEKRAEAVRAWLVQWGIEPERIETKGFGSTKPLATRGKDAEDINDRVEFIILEKKTH